MQTILQDRRRLILIGVTVLALVCLVGVLAINLISRRNSAPQETASATTAAPAATAVSAQALAQPTAATTTEAAAPEPTQAATSEPTAAPPTPEPSATPTAVPPTATRTIAKIAKVSAAPTVEMVEVNKIDQLLKNGDFEGGFAENGTGQGWENFKTDEAAVVNFSPETAPAFVHTGNRAQRISIDKAWQPDRFGGIYQSVAVVPGQPYTLTIFGQIRSKFGSVESSSYGYRVQYALDPSGGPDWRVISPTDWVELPWPEQSLDISNPTYSEYSAQITPKNAKITLFVRAWNKWGNGALAEYSLDDVSLVGPVPGGAQLVAQTATTATTTVTTTAITTKTAGEQMVDKPLPITGNSNDSNLLADGRFWGAVLILLILVAGAFYRANWRW